MLVGASSRPNRRRAPRTDRCRSRPDRSRAGARPSPARRPSRRRRRPPSGERAGDGEHAIGARQAELVPGATGTRAAGHDHVVVVALAALDDRGEASNGLRARDRLLESIALAAVDHGHLAERAQLGAELVDQVEQRHVVLERAKRDRHRPRATDRRQRSARLQLTAEHARQRQRQLRRGAEQLVEVALVDLQQLGVAQRADRSAARRFAEQRELAEHGTARQRVQHGPLRLLLHDLEMADAHDVDGVGRIAFAEQPLAARDADVSRELGDPLAQSRGQLREDGHVAQEVGDALRLELGPLAVRFGDSAAARVGCPRDRHAMAARRPALRPRAARVGLVEDRQRDARHGPASRQPPANSQACSASSASNVAAPAIAISSATPSAAPSCVETEFSAWRRRSAAREPRRSRSR